MIAMAGGYQELEDIALADSAFEAWGDSPADLFNFAALALMETMAVPSTVAESWQQELELEDSDLKELLFEWLSRMVFLKDAKAVLFHKTECEVWQDSETQIWHVRGRVIGAPIDPDTQELHTDVKAITKHHYDVRRKGQRWFATVVLDV